jgi:hypothetical protein
VPEDVFRIDLVMAFIAWGAFIAAYLWPRWRQSDPRDALRDILHVHSFRYLGLSFLLPGVVGPELPSDFTVSAAYGDLLASILALISLAVFRTPLAAPMILIFNIEGLADLLRNVYNTISLGLPAKAGQFGAAYFIVMFYVPFLLITHGIVFRLLLDKRFYQRETAV